MMGATVAFASDVRSITRRTAVDHGVSIRGFAEFDRDCRLIHVQTIMIVDAPANGRVETRPGPVVIGDNWVGNTSCKGTKLDGVLVREVPNPAFTGADHFTFDVDYLGHRAVRASVEVQVRSRPSRRTPAGRPGPREAIVEAIDRHLDALPWTSDAAIDELRAQPGR